ncbi:cupin domain-containing protein [Pseudonocardia kujensis]|uniref:cupin domain-containing protein n=1 Tax=Pseudonocardia kujensis TaxID=1128675 RepID=UPI001E63224B|nr:cupin domain-containing protein [Pseudonocardia kujensis]MCE0765015.1 cupin domain-containing protein [Pseudonocardia kujensis]
MTHSAITPTVLVSDVQSIELEDWGPLPEGTGEPMATAGKKLWTGDNDLEVGLWKCAPGPSRWVFETHESITMFAGRMTVTEDGGASYEIKAGDSAVFPKGWSGTWDIHDEVFKIYTAF